MIRGHSCIYVIRKGFCNLKKNFMLAAASSITMIICIMIFGIFYAALINMRGLAKDIESGVTVSVFMEPGISDAGIRQIGESIQNEEYVGHVEYISGEQAWEEYKEDYFDGKEELAEGFDEDNPLADSGHYNLYLNDVSRQQEVVDHISALEGVRQINQSKKAADIFTDVNKALLMFSMEVIFILAIVSMFLIQNTISFGIAMREKEISVMKSIGATEAFIQGPFIVEAAAIGITGTTVPLLVFHFLYRQVMQYVESRFHAFGGIMTFVSEDEVFRLLMPVAVCMGIGISILGSVFVIHKKISHNMYSI